MTGWGDAPGTTVGDGVNEAAAPGGSLEVMLIVTGLENVPFEGDTINPKSAVSPAVTDVGELGALTV